MALPPDPKKEAETGLKTGAEAVASVLKGMFEAAVSAMTKILPGTASTSTDSKIPSPRPSPVSNNDNSSTQLNEKLSKILKEAEEIAKDREKEMTERPVAVPSLNKGAEQINDAEEKLAADLFAKQIVKISELPPTDAPRSKPPDKPRPYPNKK